VLYAVIIVLWIAILLPMWLRRHDEALESRSVDRFSSAMRTLSSRSSADRREVVMPARRSDPLHADGPARAVADGRAVLAARRRRSLGVVLGATLIATGIVVLGYVQPWVLAIPVVVLAGFIVHVRRDTRARAALDRRRRAQAAAARERSRRVPQRRTAELDVEQILPRAPRAPAVPDRADLGEVVAPELVSAATAAAADVVDLPYDAEADRAWEPVPVPLPTYVTAPKAPRSVRVIDLTRPGLWTSGHLDPAEVDRLLAEALEGPAAADEDAAEAGGPSASAVRHEATDGDSIVTGELVIERRRVVNE
jgi:hypothetical protein